MGSDLLGQLWKLLPPHPLKDKAKVYAGEKIVIIKAGIIPSRLVITDNYQFILPFCSTATRLKVDKKIYNMEKYKIFPINPHQVLRVTGQVLVENYLSIHLEKNFVRETACSLYGKADVRFHNGFFNLSGNVLQYFNMFMREAACRQCGSKQIEDSLSVLIAASLLRHLKSNLNSGQDKETVSYHKSSLQNVIDMFNHCYDRNYSLEEVARIAHMSPYHFIRVFKNEMGQTPYQFLANIRIEKAKERLADKNMSITEVCYACGFNNPSHFTVIFKKKVGMSPSEYRKICGL